MTCMVVGVVLGHWFGIKDHHFIEGVIGKRKMMFDQELVKAVKERNWDRGHAIFCRYIQHVDRHIRFIRMLYTRNIDTHRYWFIGYDGDGIEDIIYLDDLNIFGLNDQNMFKADKDSLSWKSLQGDLVFHGGDVFYYNKEINE